jgi:hypothetical protein
MVLPLVLRYTTKYHRCVRSHITSLAPRVSDASNSVLSYPVILCSIEREVPEYRFLTGNLATDVYWSRWYYHCARWMALKPEFSLGDRVAQHRAIIGNSLVTCGDIQSASFQPYVLRLLSFSRVTAEIGSWH